MLLLFPWILATILPDESLRLVLAGVAAVLGMALLAWVQSLLPSLVWFCGSHMAVAGGGGSSAVYYADLAAFSWTSANGVPVLVLRHRKGRKREIGIPPGVLRHEVAAFLLERGLAQEPEF